MNVRSRWVIAAVAAAGLAGAALASEAASEASASTGASATNATAPVPNTGGRPRHGRGALMEMGLVRALHQLNLTDAQKQQIHAIMVNARQQLAASRQGAPDFTVLGNPGDPNYPAAIQSLQTRAAQRVSQASQVEQQIYAVLTAEQKAQLPQVLASIKARRLSHPGA